MALFKSYCKNYCCRSSERHNYDNYIYDNYNNYILRHREMRYKISFNFPRMVAFKYIILKNNRLLNDRTETECTSSVWK